jgi:glycine/D-amino acid oxidase-like deaminating enzyme
VTSRPRHASLWHEGSERQQRKRLERNIRVDVAILGAGMVGLTAAHLLRGRGARVAVLERRFVGAGATGYTTAKLSSLHGLTYARLERRHGADAARIYGEANERGIELVREVASALDIDCELRAKPNLTYTETREESEKIEDEVEAALRAGLSASLVEECELPFPIAAAVRFEDQAEFHPVRYLAGIAESLGEEKLFEWTAAVSVDAGSPCRVRTERGGVVTADHVIVATHMPILDRGLYFAREEPERSYVVAARRGRRPLPGEMYLSTEQPAHSVRAHGDWLLVAGESHKTGTSDPVGRRERLTAWARERFGLDPELWWVTQDLMPVDGVPFIGECDPLSNNIWVATGFRKWGLAMGAAAAELLAHRIDGQEGEWTELFGTRRVRLRASLPKLVAHNAEAALHFVADRVTKRGSPRCTHLGCLLDWNEAERTWDCPCHGSRFAEGGEVLEGPAVRPLRGLPRGQDG